MSKRWSKLQSRLYNIMINEFRIHTAVYDMNGIDATTNKLPRYWIVFNNQIVYDYPAMFVDKANPLYKGSLMKDEYPWDGMVSLISNTIEEYIQRSKEEIMLPFERDYTGITDILRACDKRVGKRRLMKIYKSTENYVVRSIIEYRCKME